MVFWILIAFMALAIAGLMALVLLRSRATGEPPAAYDLRVYRQQLRDVDKDLARGVINEADAGRIRTEVSRRILAADAQLQVQTEGARQPRMATRAVAVIIVLGICGGTLGIYATLGAPGYGDLSLKSRIAMAQERADSRPSQAEAEVQVPPFPAPEVEDSYRQLVDQLRQTVAKREDDAQGQALLVQHEANLGNFIAAYQAKDKYINIMSGDVEAADFGELAELMIMAAGGYVSPEAEKALSQTLRLDPGNGPARYYYGLMLGQVGRPDLSYQIWAETLRKGNADDPWVRGIQSQIEEMAVRAGVDYQPIQPKGAPTPPFAGAMPGPDAADVENAAEMSEADRAEMIRGMVARLSDRLATEGGTVQEWSRLIGALGVLGDQDQARVIYDEARQTFAGDAAALDMINDAARQAGVAE
ncbi:c-type cytochrome biogenesis protein CcmI [Phaeobacter gallaeciensis]|uniref:c-type cytochrome biogenesis protein CcmI n=1 Tax=Phaeobacter gallaeciensis TaxID=60890 RepID=UPI00237F615E|nr:c-type cytochrome biogenesis protein CcmI [Phaeobacter gallaeciensis]MDE4304300.1 c-type cytochrome biogenesis protein CcmI [Phaeobacter gallaeciensis]MDE4308357.1 c-type cytochrome biogenesis protein CcmI [Phaeobacter gallaeciensis]MDE4312814.1 c-type cytochrome biogenesis protein CcmI [Phaeobacter gallaeciensis]MDE4317231.1 c-type cytochrome biogenesis protein CcmI [Phaeobacter gallaeciensis]MDE4321694.1 c-type cytochrome biogenesis protein CcmI [Phaeobacter gallaeciensis]